MKADVEQQLKDFAVKHIDEDVVYKVHVAEGKALLDYS